MTRDYTNLKDGKMLYFLGDREVTKEEYEEAKHEARIAPFEMEIDKREIDWLEEPRHLSDDVWMQCSCPRKQKFKTNFWKLKEIKRTCPACFAGQVEEEFHATVEKKGGTLLSNYVNTSTYVKLRCAHGHEWEVYPRNIKRGDWCPQCARVSGGEDYLREVMAERGGELVDYSGKRKKVVSPLGDPEEVFYSALVQNPVIYGAKRLTLFLDGDNGFLHMGGEYRLPEHLIDMERLPVLNEFRTAKETRAAFLDLLAVLTDDYNMLNVWGNPQWQAPGVYDWGSVEPFHGTVQEAT